MERKRILKDSFHVFIGKAATMVISLISLMLLTRIMSTEDMGKYSLFLMVVNLALLIGLNWSDSSIVRHGREEFVKKGKINESFWARMYIITPIIILFSIAFYIFRESISDYIGVPVEFVWMLITMFLLNGALNFITYIYQSTDNMKKSSYVLLSQKVLHLTLLGLVMAGVFGAEIDTIILLTNLSFLLSITINIFLFDFHKIIPYKFSTEHLKKIWSFSWPQLIGFSGLYVINYVDLFFIRQYQTLHDVGVYSVAYNGFTSICSFLMIINTVFFPLIVEYRTKNDYPRIKKYIAKIPLITIIWIAIAIIGISTSSTLIPMMFSEQYAESVPSFNILLIATIFYAIATCLVPLINAFDLVLYHQIINLVKAATNIILDIILIPKIGILGAAYATLASYTIGLIMTSTMIYLNRKKLLGEKTA